MCWLKCVQVKKTYSIEVCANMKQIKVKKNCQKTVAISLPLQGRENAKYLQEQNE